MKKYRIFLRVNTQGKPNPERDIHTKSNPEWDKNTFMSEIEFQRINLAHKKKQKRRGNFAFSIPQKRALDNPRKLGYTRHTNLICDTVNDVTWMEGMDGLFSHQIFEIFERSNVIYSHGT